MTVTLYARDEALRRIGEVEDFTSLTAQLRFSGVSTFILTLDASSAAVPLLYDNGGLIVVRDGSTLLSGPITGIRRVKDGDRATVTVTGLDDTTVLAERLALPVPSGPPYSAAEYDTITAVAETAMRYYVDRNLGPSATALRRLVGLTLPTDLGRGSTVRGNGRFHTLLELLQSLALAGGDLGFRVVQVGTGLEFQVYVPTDRTGTAVFSVDLGTLRGHDYATSRPTGNYAYVGGQGEGTARTFVEGGDQASIDRYRARIEVFADRRDTADTATLEQARDELLAERSTRTALAISPIDTEAVLFGRDYNLGDRVTAVIDGAEVQDVVREVGFTLTAAEGETVTPVIGTPGATSPAVPALFEQARRQSRKISNLERR